MRVPLALFATLLAVGTLAVAAPEPKPFHVGDEEHCPLMRNNVLGVKLVGIGSVPIGEPEAIEPQYGVGLLYERTLVEMHLQAEVSAHLVSTPLGPHVPIDLVLKKPFHVSHRFEPYLGLGAVVTLAFGREHFVAPGAIGSTGLFFWLRESFGLMVEGDYAIVREPAEWRQEIEGTTGPVWRF